MLTRVDIKNYRGFKSFRLAGLASVNLLVGKNNSGKTALLESIHFLASGGDPTVLANAASRRGEVVIGGGREESFIDISHFFNGHSVTPGASFSVEGDNGLPSVTIQAVPLTDVEPNQELFEYSRTLRPSFALRVEGGRQRSSTNRVFFLSEEGALLVDPRRPSRRFVEDREGPRIVFITPDSVASESVGSMWNAVLRDKQEGEVRQAMQILEQDLEDIVFQIADTPYRSFNPRSGVLVSFSNSDRRLPLGSMGDGMRRLLALSISLIHAKGGFLIIDEIDTGFHYSIMAKMWELVVKTAVQSNIQVFATTHSSDCVKGLGVFCKQNPALKGSVAALKIERSMEKSITFTGADVLNAVEQEIEIR